MVNTAGKPCKILWAAKAVKQYTANATPYIFDRKLHENQHNSA